MTDTEGANNSPQSNEIQEKVQKSSSSDKRLYLLKERYEIDFNQPLSHLDTNGAKAYATRDLINPRHEIFALICDNDIPPRSSILPRLKSVEQSGILRLTEYGVVDYKLQNSRNMALIYQKPQGRSLKECISDDTLRDSQKLKNLLISLISISEVLKSMSITHRAFRLDNIYFKDDTMTDILVGDCVASFPAFHQPPAYETIENIMAEPEGRGNGTTANDIYSLGVVFLNLLLGKEVLKDLTSPEILRLKLKSGSYSALTKDEKVPNAFANLLRGMLQDDANQRWNYMQIYNYLEGKSNVFTSSVTQEKPQKSLSINGEKVYTAKNVAYALYNSPKEAVELLQSGKVLDWIRNGLENEKLYNKIEKLTKHQEEDPQPYNIFVAKICIAIDPSLPIKIENTIVMPDGAPKAIFYAIKHNQDLKPYIELFSSDLIKFWYMEQENLRSPTNAAEFKIYINRKDLGYGIERIIYDFDDDLPCISPLLGDEFVNSSHRILKALDDSYASAKINSMPYDKMIIAYLRCKMGKKIDGIIIDLNSNKREMQVSAIIRLYTTMQNKFGPANLNNLCRWLVSISEPLVKTYHNVKYQKYIERELVKTAKEGKIGNLHDLLENEEAHKKDKDQYAQALSDIASLISEKSKLVAGGEKLDEEAQEIGLKLGSVAALATMVTSFIFNLIYWIIQ